MYSTIRYRLEGPTGPTGACHGCRDDRAMNSADASDSRARTRVIAFGGKGGNRASPEGLENLGDVIGDNRAARTKKQ